MEKKTTRFTRSRHIIIPTYAMSAINSLPKHNPLDSTVNWLVAAVTQIALSKRSLMIDRALAEDFAEIFEVKVSEIPTDIMFFIDFLESYVRRHAGEGLPMLKFRLQVISGRLYDLIASMAEKP